MRNVSRRGVRIFALWCIAIIILGGYAWWRTRISDETEVARLSRQPSFFQRILSKFGSTSSFKNPNIILITLDTVRADHLGCYGYQRKTSPQIDRFARDGILFENPTSFSGWTLPSLENIMTGEYSRSIRTLFVPSSQTTLAELLKEKGYLTSAFVTGEWCRSQFGLGQGFDFYADNVAGDTCAVDSFYDDILNHLNSGIVEPFFLWLHFFDPHFTYSSHEEFAYHPASPNEFDQHNRYLGGRNELMPLWRNEVGLGEEAVMRGMALYDGEISYLDDYIGRLFEELRKRKLYDKSLIVLTADHGEGFGEHGYYFTHGFTVADEMTKVPLIVKMPANTPKGKVIESQVQSSDVFATILDVAGVPYQGSLLSQSLVPLICDKRSWKRQYAYSKEGLQASIRDSRYKLVYEWDDGDYVLYDIEKDPGETTKILDDSRDVFRRMKKNLDAWIAIARTELDMLETVAREIEPETQERLRALGYL